MNTAGLDLAGVPNKVQMGHDMDGLITFLINAQSLCHCY